MVSSAQILPPIYLSIAFNHVSLETQMPPMSNYQTLLKQRAELDEAIAAARREALRDVTQQVRALVTEYDLCVSDVFPAAKIKQASAVNGAAPKIAPKYKDPASGATWTGRGKTPLWIANKDRAQFAI